MRCSRLVRKPSPAQGGLQSPGPWCSPSPVCPSRRLPASPVHRAPCGLPSRMKHLLGGFCKAVPEPWCCLPSASPPSFFPSFASRPAPWGHSFTPARSAPRRRSVGRGGGKPPVLAACHPSCRARCGGYYLGFAPCIKNIFFSADGNSRID